MIDSTYHTEEFKFNLNEFKKNNKDIVKLIKEIALNGGKYE